MLRRVNAGPDYLGRLLHLGERSPVNGNCHRCDERSMSHRHRAWSLSRDHVLAAIMRLVRLIAGHVVAALHRLLVEGHGIAVGELHEEHYAQGHDERCDLPKHQTSSLNRSIFLNSRLVGRVGQENVLASRRGSMKMISLNSEVER